MDAAEEALLIFWRRSAFSDAEKNDTTRQQCIVARVCMRSVCTVGGPIKGPAIKRPFPKK